MAVVREHSTDCLALLSFRFVFCCRVETLLVPNGRARTGGCDWTIGERGCFFGELRSFFCSLIDLWWSRSLPGVESQKFHSRTFRSRGS